MELKDDQRAALRAGSCQVRRAAALLRSVNPQSSKDAECVKQICDLAWHSKLNEPAVSKGLRGNAAL